MPDLPRRRALLAVASGVAALAGCTGESERRSIDYRRDDRSIEAYERQRVRNGDGAVLFSGRDELPTPTDDDRDRYARAARRVVVSDETLDELTFGDVPEAERLRSFAGTTDFDSASLYLFAMPVEACYEIHLRGVSVEWADADSTDLHPRAEFCRAQRPADFECDVDEIHTVGFAIRLPVAADRSSGSGRRMSRSCRHPPRGEYFDGSNSSASGGEDE